MDKISINLLPSDVLVQEKELIRRRSLFRISVLFLLTIIILAGATLFIRIDQKKQIDEANQQLGAAKARVESLQQQESDLVLVRQRLGIIDKLVNQDSKQVEQYTLMNNLTPLGISVSSFNVDKPGSIVVSAQSSDNLTIQTFFNNLTDPVKNQGKITKVLIEDLSRTADGVFHMDLNISAP